jgi:hypothetical protein
MNPQQRYWALTEPFVAQTGVTRSTMMRFPCLRLDGDFFASYDHRTGDLIVKLDADHATKLIDSGHGEPFAPNGRRFREWVAIPDSRHQSWARLLDQAQQAAANRKSSGHHHPRQS